MPEHVLSIHGYNFLEIFDNSNVCVLRAVLLGLIKPGWGVQCDCVGVLIVVVIGNSYGSSFPRSINQLNRSYIKLLAATRHATYMACSKRWRHLYSELSSASCIVWHTCTISSWLFLAHRCHSHNAWSVRRATCTSSEACPSVVSSIAVSLGAS